MPTDTIVTNLQQYLDSLEFLTLSEKFAALSSLSNHLAKVRAGITDPQRFPSEISFLASAKKPAAIAKLVSEKLKHETQKYRKMRKVFAAFNVNLSNEEILRIPYPDDIEIKSYARGSDLLQSYTLFFTCKGMGEWFATNKAANMTAIRAMPLMSRLVNDYKAFGISDIRYTKVSSAEDLLLVDSIQPLIFYASGKDKKGIKAPMHNKVHLLMLYILLEQYAQKNIKEVLVSCVLTNSKTAIIRNVYNDILRVASNKFHEGPIAVFKRN